MSCYFQLFVIHPSNIDTTRPIEQQWDERISENGKFEAGPAVFVLELLDINPVTEEGTCGTLYSSFRSTNCARPFGQLEKSSVLYKYAEKLLSRCNSVESRHTAYSSCLVEQAVALFNYAAQLLNDGYLVAIRWA